LTIMTVRGLTQRAHGRPDVVLLLETPEGDCCLGLCIPMNEANRLARVLGLTPCAGVPVYDLVAEVARRGAGIITRAIVDAEEGGLVVQLVFARGAESWAIPCHPADAIALALRAGAPVVATGRALLHACPAEAHAHDLAEADAARWLARVRPEDFGALDRPA
jgi:bifunctional DNase/RNase